MSPDSLVAATSLLVLPGCCRGERGFEPLETLVLKIDISETNYAGLPGKRTGYKYQPSQSLPGYLLYLWWGVCVHLGYKSKYGVNILVSVLNGHEQVLSFPAAAYNGRSERMVMQGSKCAGR